MESTNSQRCMNEHVQGHCIGANAMVGHMMVFLSSLEAHNAQQKQITWGNMDDEVNSHPAIRRTVGSSNDMTKFERRDDRISVSRCTALDASIL